MSQVLSIPNSKDNLNAKVDLGYEEKEEIVNTLVEQGLPRVFSPSNYINRIAKDYGITIQDARDCLKEALDQIENNTKKAETQNQQDEEELYAQSGYFYPQNRPITNKKKDGMDSLSAYGTFQRLKFGL